MRPALLTDVDGVLLNWVQGFKAHYEAEGYHFRCGFPTNFDLLGWIQGVDTEEEIKELVDKFNHSDGFTKLQPCGGAQRFIEQARRDFDIIAITSCSQDLLAQRTANLDAAFGKDTFKVIHCLGLGESKSLFLKMYRPTIWIEDSLHGALQGVDAGHQVYILDRPWNKGVGDFTRLRSLAAIAEEIC